MLRDDKQNVLQFATSRSENMVEAVYLIKRHKPYKLFSYIKRNCKPMHLQLKYEVREEHCIDSVFHYDFHKAYSSVVINFLKILNAIEKKYKLIVNCSLISGWS